MRWTAGSRAANYLSVGQIYLLVSPAAQRPLVSSDIKPRPVRALGTTPGTRIIYAHLSRVIKTRRHGRQSTSRDPVTGIRRWLPTHGWHRLFAVLPRRAAVEIGMHALFKQFSFRRYSLRVWPGDPGSIHEAANSATLSHAFGAAFDNPDLVVAAVVGDGEAGDPARCTPRGTATSSSTRPRTVRSADPAPQWIQDHN